MRGRRFDAFMLVLCAILVVGGHVLVWADNNGLITGNELFSVWALPLYVGFGLAALRAVAVANEPARRHERAGEGRLGACQRHGLPSGYEAALIGAALFIVGDRRRVCVAID